MREPFVVYEDVDLLRLGSSAPPGSRPAENTVDRTRPRALHLCREVEARWMQPVYPCEQHMDERNTLLLFKIQMRLARPRALHEGAGSACLNGFGALHRDATPSVQSRTHRKTTMRDTRT
jgi:hypothetical protein